MNKKTLALHVAYIGTAVAVLMAVAAAVAIRKNGVVATKPVVEKRTPIDKVRVKTAERKSGLEDPNGATATTAAVGIVCGRDKATADRYEARNDALRSIARKRDLEKDDVAALLAYLCKADNAMRVERVAALKNDVMNLLRNQESPVPLQGLVGQVGLAFHRQPRTAMERRPYRVTPYIRRPLSTTAYSTLARW